MTDIDTTATRAFASESLAGIYAALVLNLCDALDAARAERDELRADHGRAAERAQVNHRAEAAEARLERLPSAPSRKGLERRAVAAEENLSFAQQRAADNGLRAEIGERKVIDLVAEARDLKAALKHAQVVADRGLATEARVAVVLADLCDGHGRHECLCGDIRLALTPKETP